MERLYNTDRAAHEVFNSAPTLRKSCAYCRHCGTTLEWAYHEERLYSIVCQECGTITLVKACDLTAAALKVGLQLPRDRGCRP
jgi:hypothetical protein